MGKISIFIPSLERGGIERNIVYLGKGFLAQGYEVDLLVSQAVEPYLNQVPSSVRIIYLDTLKILPRFLGLIPHRVRLSLSVLPSLMSYIRKKRPDVLISVQSSVIAVWARELLHSDTRIIVRESNTPSVALSQDKHWFSKFVPYFKRWSYPRADAIVANSEGAANDLARVIRVPRERIHVIYNPTFDDTILEKSREPLDHPWFRAGEPPVILGVGRLTRQKDFGTLLKAFALVRQNLTSKLMILGEGEDRRKLETLAKELGVEEDVELPGFVENPYKYMARASIFVLSSRYEGLPNALIEAMALKTPVVSTDCPSGPREILLEGVAGPLVPVGDFGALAKEILSLLKDKNRAMNFVKEGQKHLNRFRPETCLKKYLKLLDVISE